MTYRYIYRSAKTGQFVSQAWAKRHPTTTVRESLRVSRAKAKAKGRFISVRPLGSLARS